MENPAILLRRLNPYCARAMEGAASLCQTRAHAEILPEHWLLKLLEQGEGDLTVLARRYEWDMDAIWQALLGFMDAQPRSVRSRPQLSENIQALMQDAWLHASLAGEEHIRSIHLLMALVEKPKQMRCDGLWPLLTLGQSQLERLRGLLDAQSDERPEVQHEAELVQGSGVEFVGRPVNADIKDGALNPVLQNALDKFTLDVTDRAREGKIDPVFGRDNEIRQMVDILSRRRKNNPILVGEPGVGKTALVEGLALRIADGNVPEALKTVSVRTLDLGLLQAGAGVKGEFEQRLKNIIDAVQQSPLPVLLFIDEAHTIIGAGNQAGGADAANLLKPALARGELRTIAATTWSEYKQYFERDAALERRFQMVKVDEPDDDTACLMLRGLKSHYAEHHGVHITDEAVKAAVALSRRYLTGRQLPDKAVDLLDTASARIRMSLDTVPEQLTRMKAQLTALAIEKQALLEDIAVGNTTHSERLARQWGNMWPQPMHARIEIISSLSKRLQQVMRTLTLSYADLRHLYQAEAYLNALGDVLQRLELKHTSQLDDLRILIHNAAVRLENSENAGVSPPGEAVSLAQAERVKRVYVIEPDPQPHVQMETESPAPVKPWKPFIAGMLSMLVLSGSTVLGWQIMHKPDPAQMQFAATLAPLPAALSDEQIRFFRQSSPSPDTGIRQTQQQLTRLVQLKPDWAISYGDELLKQALMLWPEQAKPLVQQWQRQIAIAALPEDSLNGWHQGMTQLEQLAKRLNALDEQKGRYMTVSELKSAVFAMSQSFNRALPIEEQLRQLSTLPQNQPWPAALRSQTEQHLQQLITRYAALKQKTVE